MNQVLAVKNMVFIYITAVDGNAISLAMSSQTTCQVILAYLCSEHSSMRVLSLNHFKYWLHESLEKKNIDFSKNMVRNDKLWKQPTVDPESFLSYAAIGLDWWGLPMMHRVFLLHAPLSSHCVFLHQHCIKSLVVIINLWLSWVFCYAFQIPTRNWSCRCLRLSFRKPSG